MRIERVSGHSNRPQCLSARNFFSQAESRRLLHVSVYDVQRPLAPISILLYTIRTGERNRLDGCGAGCGQIKCSFQVCREPRKGGLDHDCIPVWKPVVDHRSHTSANGSQNGTPGYRNSCFRQHIRQIDAGMGVVGTRRRRAVRVGDHACKLFDGYAFQRRADLHNWNRRRGRRAGDRIGRRPGIGRRHRRGGSWRLEFALGG